MRRIGPRFSLFALAALLLGPLGLQAKEKNLPAPDWALEAAKVPTPADVGKAPAVVLYDEYLITVDAQNHAIERERIAVRLLKPQGREYTHCMISFDKDEKLNTFHAWTIAGDGHQFQAKDSDFTDYGDYGDSAMQFSEQTRVLNPPANDPGAVVACETEQHLPPYMNFESWNIQAEIPIVHQALDLVLSPGSKFATAWSRYPPFKPSEAAPNHLRWSIEKMPALDLDGVDSAPDPAALAARVSIFWGPLAVEGKENQWRALGQWGAQLQEHRTDPTPEIEAKVRELVAGAPDLYTKLSRITSYIQKNVKYFIIVRGIGGMQSHYAADIYKTHSGDCKDKTTLLIAMLRAIGVNAYYLHVDSRRGVINAEAPTLYGNHMITAIELPASENDLRLAARTKTASGKTLLIFDPTDEETPVGLIRAELQGAWGNLFDGAESSVLHMPVLAPETAGFVRKGSFTLAADGDLSGDITESMTGDDAMHWRMFVKNNTTKNVRNRMEESFGAKLPGFTFRGYEFHQVSDLDKPFLLDLHFSVPNYLRSAGPLLLLRPRILGSYTGKVTDVMEGKPRKYAIVLGNPGRWSDHYEIALPAGYQTDETPAPIKIDAGFASYTSSTTVHGSHLLYEREYVVRDVEIPPSKAADFRKFQRAILADEAGTAILKNQ